MTATAREVREFNEAEKLALKLRGTEYAHYLEEFDIVPLPGGIVRIGPIEVFEGANPDKPVIRSKDTKRTLKGSGPMKRHSKEEKAATALTPNADFRSSVSYREAFEALLPADADVSVRGSLAWWFDQAWQAAEGSPQLVDCPHPDLHEKSKQPIKHIVAFKKEATLIFKMLELAVGKAQQTVNVNTNERKLIESLEHRVVEIKLQGFDVSDTDARIDMIRSFGYQLTEGESDPDEVDGVYTTVEVQPEPAASE